MTDYASQAGPAPAVPATAPNPASIKPRLMRLPGSDAQIPVFTREMVTIVYRCSHGELGRLLCRRQAPLPIRLDGQIIWFQDEVMDGMAQVLRTLERWRH